jgi:hypothetical protein
MKNRNIKKLSLNKLKISKIDFSEKIKGGSLDNDCNKTEDDICTKIK